MRPALGTFLTIDLELAAQPEVDSDRIHQVITECFSLAEELEQLFSKFNPNSELSCLNKLSVGESLDVDARFIEVLSLALELWRESRGAFNPFFPKQVAEVAPTETNLKKWFVDGEFFRIENAMVTKLRDVPLDLNGIAKGYVADKVAEQLQSRLLATQGFVNIGGDIRFLKRGSPNKITVRTGHLQTAQWREMQTEMPAVASSSRLPAHLDKNSSSQYSAHPASAPSLAPTPLPDCRTGRNLGDDFTVTALAEQCALADALTKIGLFAQETDVVDHCLQHFGGQLYIFNGQGQLHASYQTK